MDRFLMALAWALPRRLVYWAAVRVAAAATTGPNAHRHPDGVSVTEALKGWTYD